MADKIRFATNVPSTITFNRDDCWFSDHPEFGKSFSYKVSQVTVSPTSDMEMVVEGYAYMTEILHNQLQELGIGKGASVKITKNEVAQTGKKARTEWVTKMVIAPDKSGIVIKDKDNNVINVTGAAGGYDQPPFMNDNDPVKPLLAPGEPQDQRRPARGAATLNELTALYLECLNGSAWALQESLAQDSDYPNPTVAEVQNGAACLFIEANKKGIRATMLEDLEPISNTNGNTDPDVHPSSTGQDELPFSLALIVPLAASIMGTLLI